MNPQDVKFLLYGQRIHDDDTANTLKLNNDDVIDVFRGMSGGGLPSKKNIHGDLNKILDILDNECDDSLELSDDENDELDEQTNESKNDKVEKSEDQERKTDTNIKSTETSENIMDESNFGNVTGSDSFHPPSPEENMEMISSHILEETEAPISRNTSNDDNETITETETWIANLRKDYEEGKLSQNNYFDKRIIHFLKLPTLAPVEKNILKNIVAQQDVQKNWEKENVQLPHVKTKKQKVLKFKERIMISRSKRVKQFPETPIIYRADKRGEEQIIEITNRDMEGDSEICKQTPKKRETLFNKFGIKTPSPIIKLAKVTEEEMKRISIAVHLYAEVKFGSTKTLQKVRLRENHFKEILKFAGPGSTYNLIKGRSAMQYKYLWRNSAKCKSSFRGHPETGFENYLKVHNPSSEFCHFEHCSTGTLNSMNPLEMDLVLMTPTRTSKKISHQGGPSYTSRKLFEKDKGSTKRKSLNGTSEARFKANPHGRTEETGLEICTTNNPHDIEVGANPSPTKEELTRERVKLLQNIKLVNEKLGKYNKKEEEKQQNRTFLVKCKMENCNKEFTSALGLIKHQKKNHSEEDVPKNLETCSFCGKEVVYIDKHLRTVHKDMLGEEICDVCKHKISTSDMKKHRGECIHCPLCGKTEKKKLRLLKHITICRTIQPMQYEQTQPLDLTSPMKKVLDKKCGKQNNQIVSTQNEDNDKSIKESEKNTSVLSKESVKNESLKNEKNHDKAKDTNIIEKKSDDSDGNTSRLVDKSNVKDTLDKKRLKYPFDTEYEEEYMSEMEEDDAEQYTRKRRMNKDILEIRLREIDCLQNAAQVGDDDIVEQFRLFMHTTTTGENQDGQFSKSIEPSTVGSYTRAVKNDIIKAFHQLFCPFDSRWLLDCTSAKECTFEGEQRVFVSPNEPIYLTARVLRKAMEKYNSGETGQQRATLIAATRQFMHFIELHFNNKLNLYGREPLEKVISYHNGVKSFIDATKIWKSCNKDKKRKLKNNKVLKDMVKPNNEAEILESYQKYLKSPERLSEIRKILHFASEEEKPSEREMTELGKIAMGEIITSTGCRPVVVYRLTVGAYVGKKPGFNPKEVTPEDCIIDEEQDDMKIYRRLDPNLPPKHLACKHQLEHKTAICPENCENRCVPQGFNIFCDWDKTRDTKGSSYLHIAKPIKDIMDLYDMIKTKFFKGRKPDKSMEEDWLENENTPFFLNSSGSSFQSVDLKHLSEAMGTDVTAYSFRQIVSTWALSHDSVEIRKAEGEALQHSYRVAFDHYVQNKQVQPQTLTQTYIEEEDILPEVLRKEIQKTEIKKRDKIAETEKNRQQQRQKSMLQESETNKELLRVNRPLGPRHRVLGVDRNKFKELVEDVTGENIEGTMKLRKPLKWRNFIVRTVCDATGDRGQNLRDIWVKIYKGDLQWGVRDMRLRAREKNWPRRDSNAYMQKKDRNSWIASSLLKSLQTDSKVKEKNKYVKLMQ